MTAPQNARYTIDGHCLDAKPLAGGLYIVATPIGNLGDVTLRSLATLAASDVVLCEDTRVTARLLDAYQIRASLQSYRDHNGASRRPAIVKRLAAGQAVSLVSDAGMPLISDPGYKLVREAAAGGFAVRVIPGASAAIAGLALSGLPSDRFLFCGFLPAKQAGRRRELEALKTIDATLVFYEGISRVAAFMADAAAVLGDRQTAVTREVTKLHEEVLRGPASEIATTLASRDRIRGEVTIIIAPPQKTPAEPGDIEAALKSALIDMPAGKAAAHVAKNLGVARQQAYAMALALKRKDR